MKEYLLYKNLSLNSIKNYLYWIEKIIYVKTKSKMSLSEVREYILNNYSVKTQRLIFVSLNYYFEKEKNEIRFKLPKITNNHFDISIVSKGEYENIIDNLIFQDELISQRNKMIIKVLWETGLRISELINLKWKDISSRYIKVTSKGNKTRFIPFKSDLFHQLKNSCSQKSDYVFKTKLGTKVSYSSIIRLFKIINLDGISAHSFRRTFATRLLKVGVPLNYVSDILGHSSLETTKYTFTLVLKKFMKN